MTLTYGILAFGIVFIILGLFISILLKQYFGLPLLIGGIILTASGVGLSKLWKLDIWTSLAMFVVAAFAFKYLLTPKK